jgi:serine/threonine protein kinase
MGSGRFIAGRYRLQWPIGRGAMGIVWQGRDELLDRDVAVKEVQITALASPADAETIYQRTLREARTAARLSHPGVVMVFDVVEENGSPWIVMELVSGRSLDRVITEDGPLTPPQAAELGASLVGALAVAHEAGVLHRDVKPSNVLVRDDGRAVLTDFGIATFAGDPGLTQAGMVVGTPGFTAPERVRGEPATPASDLWSLGATLYVAVEGRGPFDRTGGDTAITTGVATEEAPQAPSAGKLGPIIEALLSRDPAARPDASTAAAMLAQLGDADAPSPSGERAAFLDPPAFGELSMPEPAHQAASSPDQMSPVPADAFADLDDSALGGTNRYAPDGTAQYAPDSAARNAPDGTAKYAPDSTARNAPDSTAQYAPDSTARHAPDDSGPSGADAETVGLAAGAGAAMAGPEGLGANSFGAAVFGTLGAGAGPSTGPGDRAHSESEAQPGNNPVLWQPLKPDPGYFRGGSAADHDGDDPASLIGAGGGGDGARYWWRGRPARPPSGRRTLLLAGCLAAIVVASLVAWGLSGPGQPSQAQTGPAAPGVSAQPVAGHKSAAVPSPSGGRSGVAPGGSSSASASSSGKPSSGATSPAASPSPSSSPPPSPSPSASHSPSPSPSPKPSGPALPPGYAWHRFTAAVMGSKAGFEIATPRLWVQSVSGKTASLYEPLSNYHLLVNLAPWTYSAPLTQAQYLQRKYAASEPGYKLLTLGSIGFKTVGGFEAAPAAELKFKWTKPVLGSVTELVVVVTLATKSGAQPYTFTLWAPSGTFSLANSTFQTAMTTFRPLPG